MRVFYQPNFETSCTLDEQESKHCTKVLRLTKGDQVQVVDGQGNWFDCTIATPSPKKCELHILSKKVLESPPHYIHIAVAPTKDIGRIEWFVEKAVEIGIQEISFFTSQHSERKVVKLERIRKVAVSAMKQSLKAHLPILNELQSFKSLLQNNQTGIRLIANQVAGATYLQNCAKADSYFVCIGPEGDFSEQEISLAQEAGFTPISLGNARLRTETAALTSCIELNLLNRL